MAYLKAPWQPLTGGGSGFAQASAGSLYLGLGFAPPVFSAASALATGSPFAAYLGRGFAPPDPGAGGGQASSGGFAVYLGRTFIAPFLLAANSLAEALPTALYLGPGFDPNVHVSGGSALAAATPVYLGRGFSPLLFAGLNTGALGTAFALYLDRAFAPPTGNGGAFALSAAFTIYLWKEYFFAIAYSPVFLLDLRGISAVEFGEIVALALHAAQPNPFAQATSIRFDLPKPSEVRLDLFDAEGRHIRCLKEGRLEPGRYAIPWDGRDDFGRRCSSGIYLSRLATPSCVLNGKIVRVQ